MTKYNIPKSWQLAAMKELGQIISGGTPSTKRPEYWGGDVVWITPADLSGYNGKYIAEGKKNITNEGLTNSSARLMPAGTLLFSSRAPIGYVAISSNPLSTNQGFKNLVPSAELSRDFLYYYLKSAKAIVENVATGTTFKEISGRAFGEIPVPIPPLKEQILVADKIEELFSELDHGIESLQKAQAQIKTYRQAVLKHAFEGKLTENWRRQNNPEPAERLLERIKEERENYYQKQLEEWQRACEQAKKEGKKKPAKPKKPNSWSALSEQELSFLPNLPENWIWCKIGFLSELITKGASPNWQGFKYVDDSSQVLFITSKNIRNNYIDLEKKKFLENAFNVKQRNSILRKGDILLNIVGASIGRAAIFTQNVKANINQAVSIIRLIDKSFKEYITLFLNTSFAIKFYNSKKVDVARANLSLKDVSDIPIPLCSYEEMSFLVSEIESRLSVCDKIEQTILDP